MTEIAINRRFVDAAASSIGWSEMCELGFLLLSSTFCSRFEVICRTQLLHCREIKTVPHYVWICCFQHFLGLLSHVRNVLGLFICM